MDDRNIEQLLEKSAIRDFRLECLIKWGPKRSQAIVRDTAALLRKRLEEIPPETGEAARRKARRWRRSPPSCGERPGKRA